MFFSFIKNRDRWESIFVWSFEINVCLLIHSNPYCHLLLCQFNYYFDHWVLQPFSKSMSYFHLPKCHRRCLWRLDQLQGEIKDKLLAWGEFAYWNLVLKIASLNLKIFNKNCNTQLDSDYATHSKTKKMFHFKSV